MDWFSCDPPCKGPPQIQFLVWRYPSSISPASLYPSNKNKNYKKILLRVNQVVENDDFQRPTEENQAGSKTPWKRSRSMFNNQAFDKLQSANLYGSFCLLLLRTRRHELTWHELQVIPCQKDRMAQGSTTSSFWRRWDVGCRLTVFLCGTFCRFETQLYDRRVKYKGECRQLRSPNKQDVPCWATSNWANNHQFRMIIVSRMRQRLRKFLWVSIAPFSA